MAKNDTTPADTAAAAEVAAAPEAAKVDSRVKNVTRPTTMTHPMTPEAFTEALKGATEVQARAAFIRELWATKMYTRSQITALTRLAQGNPELKYQIIFQATKGQEGGEPPKAVAAPAAAHTETPAS